MISVDTSVLVAGLCAWHADHDRARRVLGDQPWPALHAYLETYATLTRLPAPQRLRAADAVALLDQFRDRLLTPTPRAVADLPRLLADHGITGGATYDALIAATAVNHDRTRSRGPVTALYSLDQRARSTYALFDLAVESP
ncbi:MAG: PIN domain-containing protein [Candidatus Nanopelagicales bacterium]|nr:PIN domain-containing protein [Candidatus Nanopelagicales bacterium]